MGMIIKEKGKVDMKRKSKLLFLTAMFTALTVALSGCSGDKGSEDSRITIGIAQDIEDSLDPHKVVAAGTKEVFFNIYEGLVKPDSDGNFIPAVASDVQVSEDGGTYTFTLREGIKFHDGNPVTVEDIKYSLERCADTSNGEPLVAAFSNISAVTTPDDKTVVVSLVTPDTEFLANLTTAIIPAGNTDPDKNAIGTGPYRYVSRSPQENIILESFADYWGGKPDIDHVTLRVCTNADSLVMDLNGGSMDMFMRLTSAQVDQLNDEFVVYEGTMNLIQAMYLNNAVEPFDDPKVREALCYALDRDEIFEMAFGGKGSALGSAIYPSFGKYFMEELVDAYPTNVEKAKQLLTEAGYGDGFSFTITVPSNYGPHIDTAQVLVEQLKRIGVDAEINLIEWDTWLSDVYAGRNYEATVIGVDASNLTAPALLGRYVSTASNNFVNFTSAAYDEAYAKALAATDDAEKTQYYKECERILSEEAASVYIQDLAEFVAVRNNYEGYVFYPLYVQDISKLKKVK